MQSRSKGASVWIDGYMNGGMAYSLKHWFSLSFIIPFLFFFRYGYPFSFSLSLFLGHASSVCHLFSFWGNYNLVLYFYFRDVLRESSPKHGVFIGG